MPFKSEAQRKFMFANHPSIAKRWVAEGKGDIKRVGTEDENTNKARGKAAYFSRGTVYSPGYERETKQTPPGKKRESSKIPDRQKQAQDWMKHRNT